MRWVSFDAPEVAALCTADGRLLGTLRLISTVMYGPRGIGFVAQINQRRHLHGASWGHKFLWVSKVRYARQVTLCGTGLKGGALLSFDDRAQAQPTHVLILAPTHSWALSGADPSWSYFLSGFYERSAGCNYPEARQLTHLLCGWTVKARRNKGHYAGWLHAYAASGIGWGGQHQHGASANTVRGQAA